MAEQAWDSFARLNAGDRFKAKSAEMGAATTAALVEETQVAPGMRVLDLACGSGEPSISIAALLKGTGRVVGVDFAAAPLEVARERASKRGLDNAEFLRADVHALPFENESFDRVTSRMGVMFFSDLHKALGEMRRVLKPGGKVALLGWGAMQQPYFEMTIGTVLRIRPELEIPASAQAMFKFGKPGTLAGTLREAGFAGAEDRIRKLRWDWHGSPKEMWEYFRGVTVPFHSLLKKVEGDAEVDKAVLAELNKRLDGEWVRIEAEMVVATGTRA
jgi:ubiquinone/menaquinone biosynthesis C-methylase UbiE